MLTFFPFELFPYQLLDPIPSSFLLHTCQGPHQPFCVPPCEYMPIGNSLGVIQEAQGLEKCKLCTTDKGIFIILTNIPLG